MTASHNPDGSWTPEFRAFVESIRSSEDPQHVLAQVGHPDAAVRLAVASWFSFGDEHWTGLGIDPASVPAELARGELPDDVARILLSDTDQNVLTAAVLRVTSADLVIAFLLDPATPAPVLRWATLRIQTLGALDALLEAIRSGGGGLPFESARELARSCPRVDVLEDLLAFEEVWEDALGNPALTDDQRLRIIGHIEPGRPDGTQTDLTDLLARSAQWFVDHSDIANPGGFESAELRECGPSAGVLFGAAAPLCDAAADAIAQESTAPPWVASAVTWALELTRVVTDPDSLYPRLDISPTSVRSEHVPDTDEVTLRDGAAAARSAGTDDPTFAPLADGVATLLTGLIAGGSLPWLTRYGGGNGYDGYHVFAILALRASTPVLAALPVPQPRSGL